MARARNSFVFLKESCGGERSPQFGLIVSLFAHTFTKITYWALLDFSPKANYNTDCKMWYVSAAIPSHMQRSIIPLDNLSYPLVVAFEDEHLWFLNYPVDGH